MHEMMIQFQGFHPSEFTHAYLDAKLSEVLSHAPSGANLRAIFRRKDRTLIANVHLNSKSGRIFATAQGKHLREVCFKLTEQMHKRLGRWKSKRGA